MKSITFRPTNEIAVHVQKAKAAKLNVSELINEILSAGFPKEFRRRKTILSRAIRSTRS